MAPRTTVIAVFVAAALAFGSACAAITPDFGISDFAARKAQVGGHGGQTVEVDGAQLYYETYGAGAPVLVLHGGTAYLETMHHQIEALAPDHLVIAPDSRGHGRSTDGPGPLHYHQMAEDMVALMDRLHIPKADIVGWSDGGIVALDLAIHHPKRVGRIVTMGSNFDLTGLGNLGPPAPADSPSVARQRDAYRRMSPTPDHWPAFYGKVQTMWRTEPHFTRKDLSSIRSRVLVMAGESDSIPREHTDALASAIPGAQKVIIPHASHFALLTHPEAVNAAIIAFLK
ncbi:MAG TPA: alpha/beta hydrolase [Phenylobacterium sp.]